MVTFSKEVFEKHQKVLLFCANTKWLRWLLGLNRLPVELQEKYLWKISPNSIHWVKSVNKKGIPTLQSAFFTSPRFAEALAYNLSPFVYFYGPYSHRPRLIFSPVGIIGMLLVALVPKIGFLGVMGTTITPAAGTGNGAVGNTGAVFSTVRSAADGDSTTNNPATEDNYFQCYLTGGTYVIQRNFYPTDTSALTSAANISAASINYYWASNTNVNGVGNVVVSTSQASSSTLATADFDQVGSTDFGRKLWSAHTSAAMNFIDLNASGIAIISKTGTTLIGIINTRDFDNSAPTGNNYSASRFQAYAGSSSDPYLSITYSLGVFSSSKFLQQAVNRASTY